MLTAFVKKGLKMIDEQVFLASWGRLMEPTSSGHSSLEAILKEHTSGIGRKVLLSIFVVFATPIEDLPTS